jgi:ABC-type multidrug transport system ATPase subunit
MPSILVDKLRKQYDSALAVKDVTFSVEKGELFGLIGPDGAGKTSIFRVLTTLLLPDGGAASVEGFDVVKDYGSIRRTVGYMPGKFSLYQDLTVEENLKFFATVFGTTIEENYHLIKDIYVQLEPFKGRRAGKLSGGMKQKLALCCALVHKPTVLFLDEPTTGVDVVSRREFWEMLGRLKARGITILVSTPYMDEAKLCDRIALIHEGNILAIDTPEGIRAGFGTKLYSIRAAEGVHRLLQALKMYSHTASAYAFGESVHYTDTRGSMISEIELRDALQQTGLTGVRIQVIEPSVEDCFIASIDQQKEQS